MIGNTKIDVVIAWVDGSDLEHLEKRRRFQNGAIHQRAVTLTRFADSGEIYYCIASILKYASFVNRIWIVTDNQRPKYIESFSAYGLCPADFIRIVDHRDIFSGYESALPTFNSISIETMLWRIPGVAENFVYFNDDFFINRSLQTDDWFLNGKPVLRGILKRPDGKRFNAFLRKATFRWPNPKPSFNFSQELGANAAGFFDDFLLVGHHPHPMRKSILEEFYSNDPDFLRQQVNYRFRNSRQHSIVSLANHLELSRSGISFGAPASVAYIEPGILNFEADAIGDIRLGRKSYGCIQSLDECPVSIQELIPKMMREKFGAFLPADIVM